MKKIYIYIISLLFTFSIFLHGVDNEFILPDIEEYQLNNGMRILISPNYESPVVYIKTYITVGEIDDPVDKPDLGDYAFDELYKGTKKYPKKNQLKEKLFSLGNTHGKFEKFWLNNDYGEIDHICLKEDTRDCIEIFAEVLRNPTFPFHGKLAQKLAVSFAPKNTFANTWRTRWYHVNNMYNNKVERFNPKYSLSYNKKDVRNWHKQNIRPENITLMISGDINYIYIKKIINEFFGDWEVKDKIPNQRVFNINVTNDSGIDIRFISLEDEDRASMLILKKTTDLNKFWDPSIQMALYVFGNIGNNRIDKIHQKVDRAGWMKQGWSQSNRMPLMYIQIEIEYYLQEKLYSELLSEFENLTYNSISKEELELAKITRINDYRNKTYNPQELNDFVQAYYNSNGYSLEKIQKMIDDINAVTLEEVNAAAKKVFDPNNFVMAITGNKDSCATFISQLENVEFYEQAEEIRP